MKNLFLLAFLFIGFISSAQKNYDSIFVGAQEFQKELNTQYADKEHSPLTAEDLNTFKELPFFPIDTAYFVIAKFERAQKTKNIKFKTSTDRRPKYEIYGTVYFNIHGKPYSLNIYQSHRLREKEEYSDHLFLPFMDVTNSSESYGGGRYIDLVIPDGNTIEIDFNQAYNPYCAYSGRYSCPVVPDENFIDVAIRAGVKAPETH